MKNLIILLFISFSISLSGQEVWTLERCIKRAQEQSLSVKNSLVSIEQAEINRSQAKHALMPNLSANTNFGRSYGRRIDPSTNEFIDVNFNFNSWNVNSGVTLFNGGILLNDIKRTKMLSQAAQYDARQVEQNIALDVATAYLNVIFQEENLKNAETQRDISKQQVERMEKLIEAGLNPAADLLELQAQLAREEQNVISVQNALNIGYLQLKQLMFMEPGEQIQVERPDLNRLIIQEELTFNRTFEEVYTTALNTQPNIRAGEMRERAAQISETNARRALYPTLTLGGSLSSNWSSLGQRVIETGEVQQNEIPVLINGDEATLTTFQPSFTSEDNPFFDQQKQNFGYGFSLNLSIPLYNRNITRANMSRAKLELESTRLQNESVKQNLKVNVQNAIADARAARKSLQASRKSLEASEIAFNNLQKQLDAGTANNFDFTTAKNNLAAAQVNELIAQYDYIFKLKVVDFYLGRPITLR